MTNNDTTPPEPSMDEILSSIKKMIHEDTKEPGTELPTNEENSISDEILELTELLTDDGSVVSLTTNLGSALMNDTIEQSGRSSDFLGSQAYDPFLKQQNMNEDSLLSHAASQASVDALSELQKLTPHNKVAEPSLQGGPIGGRTAEELMRELLKPLLKEWLDTNLPSLVKWLVTEQIANIMKNAGLPTADPKPSQDQSRF